MSFAHDETTRTEQETWTLNSEQMIFMLQHHNFVENAYAEDNMTVLRELEASETYKTAFGEMSWDEAYDRYESFLNKEYDTP